jgi:hypothetical protein
VVGQLPPVLPHCPLPPVSFFSEDEEDGRQCPPRPGPGLVPGSTKRELLRRHGLVVCLSHSPFRRAKRALHYAGAGPAVECCAGERPKKDCFLRFVWLFLGRGNGMAEWGGSSTSGNGERG